MVCDWVEGLCDFMEEMSLALRCDGMRYVTAMSRKDVFIRRDGLKCSMWIDEGLGVVVKGARYVDGNGTVDERRVDA